MDGPALSTKHGKSCAEQVKGYSTHFYLAWANMRTRTKPNYAKAKTYYERGINSDEFKCFVDFYDTFYESYLSHVMLHGEKDTTLERVDVNDSYTKENCIWTTKQKQAGNNSYAQLGAAMGSSVGVPTGYKNYKNKKAKLKEAEDAYQAEVNKLAELEKKYAHLGSDAYDSLKIGLLLDTIQQKQESSSFALNSKNSDYNNIRDGIVNVLSTIPKDVINAGAVGLVDSNNKPVSYSNLDTILKDSKNIFFKVKGGENTELKLVYGGKEYSIKGIEQLDKYNKSLKVVNDYLKDFSSKIKDSITNN